ncbi:hypothetical protein PENTCL1PPCAC_22240, partial [Pristionchus entomophagus]
SFLYQEWSPRLNGVQGRMPERVNMDECNFNQITLRSSTARSRPRSKQSSVSYESDESSIRSSYLDMEDRELAHAIKRIVKLDAEIRANEDVEGHVRTLRDRIEVARKNAAITVSQLNDKMDAIEQAWDDQIIAEQKEIAKEVLSILKDLKEDELSQALTWRKGSSRSSRRSKGSSSRSTIASRSQSTTSIGSSSMSKKVTKDQRSTLQIAHLDKKEREFADRAVAVKKDAKQLDDMSRNLDSINELERVVCSKLGRLQSVGDAKPSSAVYGTVELVDNYRMTVGHLANAIRSLSSISYLPAITNDEPITKAEIDKICGAMTEFMGRIKSQLNSNGPSAETTSQPQTSIRVATRASARPTASTASESGASYDSARNAPSTGRSSLSSFAASTAKSIDSQH